ncbi:MAG: hypothetical protein K5979_02765 [Ruminococcus sp.]|nr:hypothetical protein [Ruminococcus sp.]
MNNQNEKILIKASLFKMWELILVLITSSFAVVFLSFVINIAAYSASCNRFQEEAKKSILSLCYEIENYYTSKLNADEKPGEWSTMTPESYVNVNYYNVQIIVDGKEYTIEKAGRIWYECGIPYETLRANNQVPSGLLAPVMQEYKANYFKDNKAFLLLLAGILLSIGIIILCVIFFVIYIVCSYKDFVITNQKIYTKSTLGKTFEIPINAISKVSKAFKGIVIVSSTGTKKIVFIKNRNEVYKILVELLKYYRINAKAKS